MLNALRVCHISNYPKVNSNKKKIEFNNVSKKVYIELNKK